MYPNAYTDFYPSRIPSQGIEREARPAYGHPIGPNWLTIAESIYQSLDSRGINWTSIDPLAYANAGEAKPFCPLILSIGVKPHSLLYDDAVAATAVVKEILAKAGFPDIEVAFVESVVTRSVAAGPKLLSFDPLLDDVPELRKPFTAALGLSIAPLKYPHFEGTGSLFFRLSKDDNRTALLTCAHVARPPPVYPNTGMTHKDKSQHREEVIALGNMGYTNAVKAMMSTISNRLCSIDAWNDALDGLKDKGESPRVVEKRQEYVDLVAKVKKEIQHVNALQDERVIGFVLHAEKVEVSADPYGFTKDWALIELYDEKIDWANFKGNKVYVGGNLSIAEYGNPMFPWPADQANYQYPEDGLLQASSIVPADETRNPQNLDGIGEQCLLVVKHGLATGTTVGRIGSLESFTRTHDDHGIKQTSLALTVLAYDDRAHGKFSDPGDSGSIVLTREGRIVGLIIGGAGPSDETDIMYVTPYWWIEKEIKAKYPGCFLYQVVQ
ncbi:hypothetical protein CPB84DRAFT_1816946 [Gymnopilus junonius]|uniref:Uncharacterized protein n=1 Tax=Gymnopilus junonius TaxID=109634 RepID=A0A9P5NDX6_GYMJU|nr:hypothetical protein CPB84DRAFT_1816946 [Gymnopilus junonius]